MITDWVWGVKKDQNLDYITFEWSLIKPINFFGGKLKDWNPTSMDNFRWSDYKELR